MASKRKKTTQIGLYGDGPIKGIIERHDYPTASQLCEWRDVEATINTEVFGAECSVAFVKRWPVDGDSADAVNAATDWTYLMVRCLATAATQFAAEGGVA